VCRVDTYADYDDLKRHETEGVDYLVLSRETRASVAVIAIHGGGIEPGTIDIADAVAGVEYTFYGFKGIKKTGNRVLHLASHRFDEPRGLAIVRQARVVLSIHGCREMEPVVFLGGRNRELIERIQIALNAAGFRAAIPPRPDLQGRQDRNICNRCQSGRGVQLELSRGLRETLFHRLSRRSRRSRTLQFDRFTATLRAVFLKRFPGRASRNGAPAA